MAMIDTFTNEDLIEISRKPYGVRTPRESEALAAYRGLFTKGRRFRVAAAGVTLHGTQPVRGGGHQGWKKVLSVGDVLTCDGTSMTSGDGVPAVKWRGAGGEYLAGDCTAARVIGGTWDGQVPAPGQLEPIGSEATD
jgi:hypothetical protein